MAEVLVKVTVTARLEHVSGRFAPRDEIEQVIVEEIEGMDPGSVDGVGVDGETTYNITEWEVEATWPAA